VLTAVEHTGVPGKIAMRGPEILLLAFARPLVFASAASVRPQSTAEPLRQSAHKRSPGPSVRPRGGPNKQELRHVRCSFPRTQSRLLSRSASGMAVIALRACGNDP